MNPGPIRLLNGRPGPRGWGWLHLTTVPDRSTAITRRGYANCQAFVFDVAANWTEIHAANEPGRIKAVLVKDGYELAIVLEWNGRCWSVTTALPFRATNRPKLYIKTA